MKLNNIRISNFLGLRHAEMALTSPVTIIAGKNGAGKSSLQEAIRIALLGEPTRVSLKKELGQLVTNGQKKCVIQIDHSEGSNVVELPSGTTGITVENDFLRYVLDMGLFARQSADSRRRMLFDLTGCSTSAEAVKEKLLSRKASPAKIEAVLPLLRSGFPTAEKEARTKATEAKGAWRAITGETYGEKKADGWEAEAPALVSEGQIMQTENDLDLVDAKLNEANQELGALRAKQAAAHKLEEERAGLEERAGRIDRIQAKLATDEAELATWTAKVEETRAVATSTVRHSFEGVCPCCGEELVIVSQTQADFTAGRNYKPALQRRADAMPGDQNGSVEAIAKLPEYEQALAVIQRAVINDKRDLALANEAVAQLAAFEQSETVSAGDVETVETRIHGLKSTRNELNQKLQALQEQSRQSASANTKTKQAAQHHADIQEWLLIADALAADGIPSELLSGAIGPVNKLLMGRSAMAEWGDNAPVAITPDMELTFDSRPYALLSESEKWRVDCLVSLVIAELSGLKLVLLDRMDVLDIPARGQLITLLDSLAQCGSIDTAIVTGTLKAVPQGLPATMQAAWISGGNLVHAVPSGVAA